MELFEVSIGATSIVFIGQARDRADIVLKPKSDNGTW